MRTTFLPAPNPAQMRQQLAFARADAVRAMLASGSHLIEAVASAAPTSGAGEAFRKVEVSARRQSSQRIILHEAGHMFGLGDEYVERDPS
jgi:hypothetical protein